MRLKENYTPLLRAGLLLTVAILVSFQAYILREPARIKADETRDRVLAVTSGGALYAENCAVCHGEDGEGVDAPPLNDRRLLSDTADATLFSVIGSGVPNTEMPAWSQLHGGPFTDSDIRQIVAFIRDWAPEAPDRLAEAMAGDPLSGLEIFNSTCIVCHGEQGQGTDRAPALNDPVKLAQFDDEWYADTIAEGRPARGMPTWGTVLSPVQIADIVALLRAWEQGETVEPSGIEVEVAEALHALDEGDAHAAEHALERALPGATGEVQSLISRALEALDANDAAAAQTALVEVEELLGATPDEHGG